jgi:hypothetical protein
MFALARLRKEECKKRKWSRGGGRRKKDSEPLRLRRERKRKKDRLMLSRRMTLRSQRPRRKCLRHLLKIPKTSEAARALPKRPQSKLRNRCVRFYLYNIDTSS